ncbi:MAG TPA: AMP-binding protein [Quisquiliibacterium sp.]|nr:AMP-binding protein [Quisquiliibacterium sp.]
MQAAVQIEECPDTPQAADPRIPPRDRVVTRALMERWNRECPDKVFAKFGDDGEEWTYRELREKVLQTALGLQRLGVEQGDHVLVWLPNSRENLRVYFAISYLGAVYVPINTAYKGSLLAHVVELSDAKLAVVHSDLAERFDGVPLARLEAAVVVGDRRECPGLKTLFFTDALLPEGGTLRALRRPIEPWDPQSIIFTSGTTGPSKGVLSSYLHCYTGSSHESWYCVTPEDRFMVNMPMFHVGGTVVIVAMFARGGSVTFIERFDTDSFLDTVRATQTTAVFLLGVMASFLEKSTPRPDDAGTPLRLAFMVPLAGDIGAFSRRFGCDVYTIFNMTEISTPVISEANPLVRGTCGKMRAGVDVRLVDENDCEVAIGEIGEMMIRTDRPWAMNSGYYKNPEATARAWRNGWFHTGDAFRKDADGYFHFVDRMKDAIRRRGENISSFEVEAEVAAHPDVREAAAVGVASEFAEEDVLVVVAPVDGRSIDPAALLEFLRGRMAHFMVPRYIRILPELPKTPTSKVLKHELRAQGVTPDTWDREAAGIRVKADRFTKTTA